MNYEDIASGHSRSFRHNVAGNLLEWQAVQGVVFVHAAESILGVVSVYRVMMIAVVGAACADVEYFPLHRIDDVNHRLSFHLLTGIFQNAQKFGCGIFLISSYPM